MDETTHIALPKKALEQVLNQLNQGPRALVQPLFDLVAQGLSIIMKPQAVSNKELKDGESQAS